MGSNEKYFLILSMLIVISVVGNSISKEEDPIPSPWPLQFHSILLANYSGSLAVQDLWYDWPNRRNLNIIQYQLGSLLYDLEWNNGTSFYYTLDSSKSCYSLHFDVGILRPNWLDGANYLRRQHLDGFLCNVWEKLDFIWYYEDVHTKRPVYWRFYDGNPSCLFRDLGNSNAETHKFVVFSKLCRVDAHVMTFEVDAVLEDEKWQSPVYCFDGTGTDVNTHDLPKTTEKVSSGIVLGMRPKSLTKRLTVSI